MNEPAIEARGLTRRYGAQYAVRDVDLRVERGQIFALLGPNGAGKTTTIRMVLGLIQPSAGSVRVLGSSKPRQVQQAIGYLPEERGLYRDQKVIDNLVYLATLKGVPRREARQRALGGLRRLALDAVANKPVKALSRGMQQQVQLLATLLHRPELLIVDEPFSGLDPVNTRRMRDLLQELRDAGTTLVMSTHQMNRVEELCENLVMLQHGRVVLEGSVDEVRRRFSGGTVVVACDEALGEMPEVAAATPVDGGTELTLADGVRPHELLARLAARPALGLRRFEVHTPSLEEIFITVAGGGATPPDASEGE